MKIILKSLNFSPELTGIGKYNGEMCRALVERNISTTAIVAPQYYPEWQIAEGFNRYSYSRERNSSIDIIRCPLFVPKNVTTLKRIIHLFSFSLTSCFALFSRFFTKPDVVILIQPTLFCAPATLLFAKLRGCKAVLHIQDFEVDALFGLGMMKRGYTSRLAINIEKWLMRKFDAVSTISYSMVDNARIKGVSEEKLINFPNWADINFVTPETDGSELKAEWGFDPFDQIVLYAGNIGNKQGLEIVLTVAKSLSTLERVKFVFVGTGAYVKTLKEMSLNLNLKNVYFMPIQPWANVPQMLALADIHLVVQRRGAADAVLPSKLTNILSAGGHAIVTAEAETELGMLAKKHPGIYDLIEPECPQSLEAAIESRLKIQDVTCNTIARNFAMLYLDKDKIIDKYIEDLTQLFGIKSTN